MIFSREHKYVFILDEFCGEKNVTQLLQDFDFYFLKNKKETQLKRDKFTNLKQISKEFQDYTLVRLVDNPYKQIINEFKSITEENWSLKQHTKEHFIQRFNRWIDLYFENWDEIYFEKIMFQKSYNHFLFNSELNKKPDFFIKVESMERDILNIPLFKGLEVNVRDIFFPRSHFDFQNVFTYENARKIFKLNRDFFIETQYDPFSFTTQELTKKKKVDFIHW
jgi:hypothetical protein